MTIVEYLRHITGNKKLKWRPEGCPHINFELNGLKYTLLKRTAGYQLNVEGCKETPSFITNRWVTIRKRLEAKISSNIVK